MKFANEHFTRLAINSTSCDDIDLTIDKFCEVDFVAHATFHMLSLPNNSLAFPFVRSTYTQDWLTYYLINNLMMVDPIVRHSQNTELPFFWSEVSLSQREHAMMELAVQFDVGTIGYTVPTVDIGPYRGIFSITASQGYEAEEWRELVEPNQHNISKVAVAIHGFARAEIDPFEDYAATLSKREVECLKNIAAGKTYTEIAVLMKISEHTVRSYGRTIRLKLDCSTLAQAVAKACSMGVI